MKETEHQKAGIIREYRVEDLDEVVSLANKSMSEYYTRTLIHDISKDWPEGFLVYVLNNRLAGFITGSKYSKTEARILLLAVEDGYRRRGYGRALMNEFIKTCMENSILSVRLEVKTDNTGAIKFYRDFRFVITSVLKNYYSDSSDAYLMWRML